MFKNIHGNQSTDSLNHFSSVQEKAFNEKSPINMKNDINEVTPDIDINNNSPLAIESGS